MKMIAFFAAVIAVFVAVVVVQARHIGAKPPSTGTPAPDFTLNSQDGKPVSLRELRGKWVILYFYPKDFTSGCTVEARTLQHDLAQFELRNAVILGVSGQDEHSHQKLCAQEGLFFMLLGKQNSQISSR